MLKELCAAFGKDVVYGLGALEGCLEGTRSGHHHTLCWSCVCGNVCGNSQGRTVPGPRQTTIIRKRERGHTKGERKMRCERRERPGAEGRPIRAQRLARWCGSKAALKFAALYGRRKSMVNAVLELSPPGVQVYVSLFYCQEGKPTGSFDAAFHQITQRLCTQSVPILSFRACRPRRLLPFASSLPCSYAFFLLPHFSCVELCRKAANLA